MDAAQTLGHEATPRCRGPHEVIYHPGPDILVTERCIHTESAWFRLADLSGFTVERGVDGAAVLGCLIGALVLAVTAGGLVASGLGGSALTTSIVLAVLSAAAVALVVAGLIAHGRRIFLLWARHRGDWVLLYATPDRLRHRAVMRALSRSWQDNRD
jgi:hypothetical protein